MKEKIRYTKKGKRINIYEFKGKLHQKIIMTREQYENHIIIKHPEIELEIIREVLEDPDYVTKQSKSRKEHFYQKQIGNLHYFIVVSEHKNIKNLRFVLSGFSVINPEFLEKKNIYYRYSKK